MFRDRLNAYEEEKYKVNSKGVTPREFYHIGLYGSRRYLLKTPDELIPSARRVMRIMYVVDRVSKTVIYGGLLYWLIKLIISLFSGANIATTLFKILFCLFWFVV